MPGKDKMGKLDKLPVGTEIILEKGNNSNSIFENKKLVITYSYGNGTYQVKDTRGVYVNIYTNSGVRDIITLFNRKDHAQFLRKKADEMRLEANKIEEEALFYEKYQTEEDYLAEKLLSLVKSGTKEDIVKILKEMKKTNFL
jgi:hypothetical protein